MAQYDGSIRINTQIQTKQAQINLTTLENRMVKTAGKIASLRSKMDSLKDAKIPTQEYKNLENEISSLEKKLLPVYDKQERFLETGGKEGSNAYKRMAYDAETLERKLQMAESEMKRLVDSGKAFTLGSETKEYEKLGNDLKYAESEMELLKKKHDLVEEKAKSTGNQYKKLGKTGKSAFSVMSKGAEVAKSGIKKIGAFAKSAFAKFNSSANKSGGTISKFSSRLKGILSSLLIFNWVTKAFNSMVSGLKEGFSNLYNDNKKFANAVNGLKASVLTLKNSIASAFAPIVTVAIPYLQSLVNTISVVMDKIAQFAAAITGQKTYLKAVKQTTAAIEDQGKKASKSNKKQLSGLDKLNNLSKEGKSNDGGDSAGTGEMFKEVKVGSNFEDLAEKFRKMWGKADFTDLGTFLGQKLKEGLENIPWADIQKTAEKVGKSFATLINGFVKVPGLAYTIGNTIAQAIDTGIRGLNSFAKSLDWGAVGTFIEDGINGVLTNIDWATVISAASFFGAGIATLLNNALTPDVFQNIGTTIGKGINTAITFAHSFLTTFNWSQFGSGIAIGLNSAISSVDWSLVGTTFGNALNAFFSTLGSFAEQFDWSGFGESIGNAVSNAVKAFDWAGVGKSLSIFVNGLLSTLKSFIDKTDFKSLGKGITNAISTFFGSLNWKTIGGGMASFATSIYRFFIGLVQGVDWKGIPEKIITSIGDFFAGIDYANFFGSVGEWIATAIVAGIDLLAGIGDAIADAWDGVVDYFSRYIEDSGGNIMKGLFNGIIDGIKGIGKWIKNNVFDPFINGFKKVFGIHSPSTVMATQGGYIMSGLLNGLKSGITAVLNWLKNLPGWFKEKFVAVYNAVKRALSGVKDWLIGIFSKAWDGIKSYWSSVGSFFSDVWKAIKGVFGGVISWFKNKFSAAWTAVKNVFSTGGKIFDGIKDGILSGLKTVINGIISGINKVIAVPFNGLNSALKKIKSVSIAGLKPFDWMPTLAVPQIPKLATGAVIPANKEFMAVLGDQKHGRNLEAPEELIRKIVREETAGLDRGGGDITLNLTVECEGYKLLQLIQKLDKEQYSRTGKPSFQM